MKRSARSTDRRRGNEVGAAVVDFVLVSVVLMPLFLGLLQVGLVLHVRNTLAAAATEGARYAATVDRDPSAGVARTREQIRGALTGRFADHITAGTERAGGVEAVVVRASAEVPPLGLWGPGIVVHVEGHGVEEEPR